MGDPTDFAVAVELVDDRAVVHVEGELDLAHAPAFEDAVATVADTPRLVLNLTRCTFVDSSGVRVIAAVVRDAASVEIVATSPAVLRVLELTGVDEMVTIHSSLDTAL